MKVFLICLLVLMTGCVERTNFGECVGAFDEKDPKKVYKVSTNNVIVGLIFAELIAPPVLVIFNQFHCPVGNK